jgi:uncharacterized LabA/DUF88 family protein
MAAKAPAARLAVLIDAENASPHIAPGLFQQIAKFGNATIRRIYGDFSGTRHKTWVEALPRFGILPRQHFANIPGKNAQDIALVIDAMDLLHEGGLDGVCLVSSDSDFTLLAIRIREQGLAVYGFGEAHTPEAFRSACKQFVLTEPLPPPTPKPPKAAKQPKPPKKQPRQTSLTLPGSVEPVSHAVALIQAVIEQISEDDGWTKLHSIGTALRTLSPSFKPRAYGYGKLSDLVTKSGAFDVRLRSKQIFVRPIADDRPLVEDNPTEAWVFAETEPPAWVTETPF